MKANTVKNKLIALALAASTLIATSGRADPGDLDTTFGAGGKVISDFGSFYDLGFSVALQADGKILVVGDSNSGIALARYTSTGALDTAFNGTGMVTTSFGGNEGRSVAVQPDGKILVAGFYGLARYTSTGALDTSFNGTGMVTTVVRSYSETGPSVAVQADGKILVAGDSGAPNYDFAVVRYNTDGSLDTSFNGTGMVTTDLGSGDDHAASVAVQADGNILVAGSRAYDFALVRYTNTGALDTTFNGTGIVTTDFGGSFDRGYSVAVQPDGKILVAGESSNGGGNDFGLARYTSTGALDTSFNGTGMVTTDFGGFQDRAFSVAVQADGKILVAGESSNGIRVGFGLARYTSTGALDTSFNGTGKVNTGVGSADAAGRGVAVQTDGKIVVAGFAASHLSGFGYDFALLRYHASSLAPLVPSGTIFSGSTGTAVSGEPAGTYYAKVGIPSVNDAGTLTFQGQIKLGSVAKYAVLTGSNPTVLVRQGDAADGGGRFSTFHDPLLNQANTVAFVGVVTGSGITTTSNTGFWSNAFGAGVQLVARTGTLAASCSGAKISSFTSVALESGSSSTPMVAYVAKIAGSGVTTANNIGLWSDDGTTTRLLLRTGMSMTLSGSTMTLSTFTVLGNTTGAQGQGFGLSKGSMTALLNFIGGSKAMATVFADGTSPTVIALKGDHAPEYASGAHFYAFKTPGQNSIGGALFLAGINGAVASGSNSAIYRVTGGASGTLDRVLSKGEPATGLIGVKFSIFSGAAYNSSEWVAFTAQLAGTGVNSTNESTLWEWDGSTFLLVAREGETAPDTGGAKWRKFYTVAIPDNGEALFTAQLLTGTGTPATTAANDIGLWGRDSLGNLRLLAREGDTIGGRTVSTFIVLPALAGTLSQTRSHNGTNAVAYLATFTNGTKGIIKVQIP